MAELSRMAKHVLVAATTVLLLGCVLGCEENEEPAGETAEPSMETDEGPAAAGDCHDRAVDMANRVAPFTKVKPEIEVPFDLPSATGREPVEGTPVLVGPEVIRVDQQTFEVSDGDDPTLKGGFSDELVEKVSDAIVAEANQQKKEAEILGVASNFVVWLGVHPEMPASAVQSLFDGVARDTSIGLLVLDADAPDIPERKTSSGIEPLLERLSDAENDDEIKELTESLESKVMGDCRIALFRMWVGHKTGASTLEKSEALKQTPLAEAVAECGCDDVDLEALEAAIGWALTPPHGPLAVMPSSYERAFAEPEQSWSEVVKAHENAQNP